MLTIPDRISMDELSNLWILKALQELNATAEVGETVELDETEPTADHADIVDDDN